MDPIDRIFIDQVNPILYILGIAILLIPTTNFKYNKFKTVAIIFVCILIPIIYWLIVPEETVFTSILIIVLPIVCFYILSKDSFATTMYLFFERHNIAYIAALVNYFFQEYLHISSWINSISICIVFAILFLYINKNKTKTREFLESMNKSKIRFLFLPMIYTIFIRVLVVLYGNGEKWALYVSVCVIIVVIINNMFVGYAIKQADLAIEREKIIVDLCLMNNQKELQDEQLNRYRKNQENIARQRHDLRHHNNVIINFLKDEKIKQAMDYIHNIQKNIDDEKVVLYCEHETVNVVFSIYIKKALKNGIKVEMTINVPQNINIDNVELASVYANALENAIEACMRLPEHSLKKIKIYTDYKNKKLRLLIENTSSNNTEFDTNDLPVSQKELGGIGTKSMKYIIAKYDGLLDFTEENSIFTTKIIFQNV